MPHNLSRLASSADTARLGTDSLPVGLFDSPAVVVLGIISPTVLTAADRLRVQLIRADAKQGFIDFQCVGGLNLTRTVVIRRGVACYPVVNPVAG